MKDTLPVLGERKTSLSPQIGNLGPRRQYKQNLLLSHWFTAPSPNFFALSIMHEFIVFLS